MEELPPIKRSIAKENMTIIKDDFWGQWNYRAVPATGAETSEVIF